MESYQEQVLAFLKGELAEEEKQAFKESLARSGELRAELERSRALLDLMEAASEKAITHRVDQQIRQAIERGASDIHLNPGTQETVVSFRQDGQLQEFERIPREATPSVIDRWKVLADCSLSERQLPQEGRVLITQDKKGFDLRVMIVPTVLGERVTVRVLSKSGEPSALDRLGFTEEQLAGLRRLIQLPSGFVGVTGPVGSGKTTTLYGMLLDLRAPDKNVMTVEEPVEFVLEGISQTRVNRRIGLTYAAALRAVFRSDLDVVMISSLQDREVAEIALQMAATGHLVLAQLITSSAIGMFQRLRALEVDPFLLAQSAGGAAGLRLPRQVCRHCTQTYEPSVPGLQRLGLTPEDGPFQRGKGCEACRNSGYLGRVVLMELLEMDDALRPLVASAPPYETLWRESFGRTGGSLWDDARAKVRQGLTTVEEANRVLFDYPYRPPEGTAH